MDRDRSQQRARICANARKTWRAPSSILKALRIIVAPLSVRCGPFVARASINALSRCGAGTTRCVLRAGG